MGLRTLSSESDHRALDYVARVGAVLRKSNNNKRVPMNHPTIPFRLSQRAQITSSFRLYGPSRFKTDHEDIHGDPLCKLLPSS